MNVIHINQTNNNINTFNLKLFTLKQRAKTYQSLHLLQ